MNLQRGWASAIVVLASFGLVSALLEWASSKLSPQQDQDPRLGALMFWVWGVVVGGVTYALWPYMGNARPLEYAMWGIGVLGWLAWKLGISEGWEGTPREREQIWATTIGVVLAVIAWDVRH